LRRRDREITNRQEIDAIIRDCLVCRLAMARDDQPYLVPISFGYDGAAVYVHTAREGHKIAYLEAGSRVCFEFERNVELVEHATKACDWSFRYETVVGFGTPQELLEDSEKRHGLDQIMRQYSDRDWSYPQSVLNTARVWRISIDSVTAKRSVEKVVEGG
jgi:nitroimidazol reductase NimA-like FMN-containing flavoprotein (pyridoxamine 5'-phosphate oxidase superfamily)